MKKTLFVVTLSLIFLTSTSLAVAQTTGSSAGLNFNYSALTSKVGQGGLSMSMSPQYPAPNEAVSFTLQDFQDDLNTAMIVWTVGGTVVSKGEGNSSFQITAGAAGSSETVGVSVTTSSGITLTKTITIKPAGVDLLWQAHSYVPPFYQGKALFPLQGTVTVTAMPTFALTNPQNAIYAWKLGCEALPDLSGLGKNVITLTGSILLRPIDLTVTVKSQNGSVGAQGSLSLTGINPAITFYQENSLYGILYNKAVGQNLSLTGQVGLDAEPYFFDTTAPYTSNTTFQWNMNGQNISNQTGHILNVAPPGGQSGNATVSVTATNPSKQIQSGSANVDVSFGSNQ